MPPLIIVESAATLNSRWLTKMTFALTHELCCLINCLLYNPYLNPYAKYFNLSKPSNFQHPKSLRFFRILLFSISSLYFGSPFSHFTLQTHPMAPQTTQIQSPYESGECIATMRLLFNDLHYPQTGLHTDLFFEKDEVHSLGPAWTSLVLTVVETKMPKDNWFNLNPFLDESGISSSKWSQHRRGFPLMNDPSLGSVDKRARANLQKEMDEQWHL